MSPKREREVTKIVICSDYQGITGVTREDENFGTLGLSHLWMICSKSAFSLYANCGLLVLKIGHVKILSNGQSLNFLNVIKAQFNHR